MKIISDITLDSRFTKGKEYTVVSLQDTLDTVAYMVIANDGRKHALFMDEFHIPLKKQSHIRWRKIFKAKGFKKKEVYDPQDLYKSRVVRFAKDYTVLVYRGKGVGTLGTAYKYRCLNPHMSSLATGVK